MTQKCSVLILSRFQKMTKIENMHNFSIHWNFKLRLRKIVKEKLIYIMFSLQLVQSEIVFLKKILFWNFGLKKSKKSCLKTPFSENRNVFGWILKANFHILMPLLWTKNVFMPKYGKKSENKCQKKSFDMLLTFFNILGAKYQNFWYYVQFKGQNMSFWSKMGLFCLWTAHNFRILIIRPPKH